jgi:hypothetical protein
MFDPKSKHCVDQDAEIIERVNSLFQGQIYVLISANSKMDGVHGGPLINNTITTPIQKNNNITTTNFTKFRV